MTTPPKVIIAAQRWPAVQHLRTHGVWPDGVPAWAEYYAKQYHCSTTHAAVLDEVLRPLAEWAMEQIDETFVGSHGRHGRQRTFNVTLVVVGASALVIADKLAPLQPQVSEYNGEVFIRLVRITTNWTCAVADAVREVESRGINVARVE